VGLTRRMRDVRLWLCLWLGDAPDTVMHQSTRTRTHPHALRGLDRLLEAPDVLVVLVEQLPLHNNGHALRTSDRHRTGLHTYPGGIAGHGERLDVLIVLASNEGAGQVAAIGGAAVGVRKGEVDLGPSKNGVDRAGRIGRSLACTVSRAIRRGGGTNQQ
jgi:hypothetical protein